MPGFDRTGPEGQGPRTGRRMGKCNQKDGDNTSAQPQGRGRGRGMGLKSRNGQEDAPGIGRRQGRFGNR